MICSKVKLASLAICLVLSVCSLAEAGCPFDDGSCQEYCNQQGCNLGYCGHFAWIQCICRKCGDEWNWYDKVHYNPDKQVNQTELDSLKLNGSAPLILTTNNNKVRAQPINNEKISKQPQEQQMAPQQQLESSKQQKQQPEKQAATLTTLLIPDLSDGTKLDLNEIPDENSEKFLDYLAKNHEKLAQATNAAGKSTANLPDGSSESVESDDDESGQDADGSAQATGTSADEPIAEETVEIQISSSNNQQQQQQQAQQVAASATNEKRQQAAPATKSASESNDEGEDEQEDEQKREQRQHATGSPVTRLLKKAVAASQSPDLLV